MTSYTIDQLSIIGKSLTEKPRIELLYYIYTFGPIHQGSLVSITGYTQAKVSRHSLFLERIGIAGFDKIGASQRYRAYYIKQEYRDFYKAFFDMLSLEQKQSYNQLYDSRKLMLLD